MSKSKFFTISLVLNLEADTPKEAAQYFREFVADGDFVFTVENDQTGKTREFEFGGGL